MVLTAISVQASARRYTRSAAIRRQIAVVAVLGLVAGFAGYHFRALRTLRTEVAHANVAAQALQAELDQLNGTRDGLAAQLHTMTGRLEVLQAKDAKIERVMGYLKVGNPELSGDMLRLSASNFLLWADRWNVNLDLLIAQQKVESSGQAGAVSRTGDVGIAQFQPSTAAHIAKTLGIPYGTELLAEPSYNAFLQGAHLSNLLGKGYALPNALTAYNAGESNAGSPNSYAQNVLATYQQIKQGH